jgi:ABC-type transport system substrate-binding protein
MNGSEYGSTYAAQTQTVAGMLQEGGFRIRQEPHQYGPIDWHTNIYYGYSRSAGTNKGFSGLLYSYDFPYPTYPLEMYANFHKDGSRYHGMTPTGNNAFDGDPYVNDACDKVQGEFDIDKQVQLAREVDNYMTGKAYFVPVGYGSRTFGATWPVVQNLGVFSGTNASLINYWLDDSKPPLGQA